MESSRGLFKSPSGARAECLVERSSGIISLFHSFLASTSFSDRLPSSRHCGLPPNAYAPTAGTGSTRIKASARRAFAICEMTLTSSGQPVAHELCLSCGTLLKRCCFALLSPHLGQAQYCPPSYFMGTLLLRSAVTDARSRYLRSKQLPLALRKSLEPAAKSKQSFLCATTSPTQRTERASLVFRIRASSRLSKPTAVQIKCEEAPNNGAAENRSGPLRGLRA